MDTMQAVAYRIATRGSDNEMRLTGRDLAGRGWMPHWKAKMCPWWPAFTLRPGDPA
ncbi:MAG TPA: hypothetical protein VGO93_23675 [Candidatus Xenobia bacterium]